RGGGIYSEEDSLTLKGSTVTQNRAIVSAPYGRLGRAGGVLVDYGTLTVDGSLISDNSASLSTSMPTSDLDVSAFAGGVQIRGDDSCAPNCVQATFRDSTISGNRVTASNDLGDAVGFGGAIVDDDGSLVLGDT